MKSNVNILQQPAAEYTSENNDAGGRALNDQAGDADSRLPEKFCVVTEP